MTEETIEWLKKMIKWTMAILALISALAFLYYLWAQQQQQPPSSEEQQEESSNEESIEPTETQPSESVITPTSASQEEYTVLSPTFEPEVANEGDPQKLAMKITNQTSKPLIIKEAKIDWYYNPGSGFYLAEKQTIGDDDPHWLATKVPAWSTKTVYMETSKSSGKGKWQGKVTVTTSLGVLNAEVVHIIQ